MIPPEASAGFVAAREDVLETYQKPRDPDRPLVCLDETSKQLIVEARRLAKRFEWHYTPKHGSWLDMAEFELGVLSNQCLSRRIPDKQNSPNGGRRLAGLPQQTPHQGRLAIHHSRRPRKAQKALPPF